MQREQPDTSFLTAWGQVTMSKEDSKLAQANFTKTLEKCTPKFIAKMKSHNMQCTKIKVKN